MQKSFREFLATPIRERLSKGLLGKVGEFIINPTNGEILALFTRKDKKLLLPTIDIAKVTSDAIWVENPEALATPNEIVRIEEIIKLHTPIFKNKVFTVSRSYLGEVIDFRFETNGWILTKIEVAKNILGIPTQRKLINASQIVRIKPNEITVRDAVVKVKAKRAKDKEIETKLTPVALSVTEEE